MKDAAAIIAVVAVFIAINAIFLAEPEKFITPEITGEVFTDVQLNYPANGSEINQSNIVVNLTSIYDTNCTINGSLMDTTGAQQHLHSLSLSDGEYSYELNCGVYNTTNQTTTLTFSINTTSTNETTFLQIINPEDESILLNSITILNITTNGTNCNYTLNGNLSTFANENGTSKWSELNLTVGDNEIIVYCDDVQKTASVELRNPGCGNEFIESGEDCDDGNSNNDDGCLNDCILPTCGDDYIWIGQEDCEDDNDCNNDETCEDCECVEESICGNNDVEPGEECERDSQCDNDEECDDCECVSVSDCGNGDVESGEECERDSQCGTNEECRNCECRTIANIETPSPVCANYWVCTEWQPQECKPWDKDQLRTCINTYDPKCRIDRPVEKQFCLYTPTCDDMIRNQGEEGIDCGGPCQPCTLVNILGSAIAKEYIERDEFNETTKSFDERMKRTSFLLSILPIVVVGIYFFLNYKLPKRVGFTKKDIGEAKEILDVPIKEAIKAGYTKNEILQMMEEQEWERAVVDEVLKDYNSGHAGGVILNNYIKKARKQGKTKRQIQKLLVDRGWSEKEVQDHIKKAS